MERLVPRLVERLVTPIHQMTSSGSVPPTPPGFTPSLDFSDLRNSQYLAALMEDI